MNTDGGVNKWILFGDSKRRRVRVRGDFPVTDTNDDLDSGFDRALDHSFAIRIEFASLKVSMRVDVHRRTMITPIWVFAVSDKLQLVALSEFGPSGDLATT